MCESLKLSDHHISKTKKEDKRNRTNKVYVGIHSYNMKGIQTSISNFRESRKAEKETEITCIKNGFNNFLQIR